VFILTVRHGVMSSVSDEFDMPVIVLGLSAFIGALAAGLAGNFFFRWSFVSTSFFSALGLFAAAGIIVGFVGKGWNSVPFGMDFFDGDILPSIGGQLIIGIVLINLAVIVMTSIAIAFGGRFGQVVTLLICLAFFAIGSIHPYLFARRDSFVNFDINIIIIAMAIIATVFGIKFGLIANLVISIASVAISLACLYFIFGQDSFVGASYIGKLFPRLTYFYQLSALSNDRTIPTSYLFQAMLYCTAYVAAALSVGMAMFQNRSLDAQGSSDSMPTAISLITRLGQLGGNLLLISTCFFSIATIIAGMGIFIPIIRAITGLACGSGIFYLWTAFARKRKWSYYAIALLHFFALAAIIILWKFDLMVMSTTASLWLGAFCVIVLTVLVFPKTRHNILKS